MKVVVVFNDSPVRYKYGLLSTKSKEIGKGGFSKVYESKLYSSHMFSKSSSVAVKVIHKNKNVREIQVLRKLFRKNHILQLIGCSVGYRRLRIVTELCLGSARVVFDSFTIMRRFELCLYYAPQIMGSVTEVHRIGYVHRDIKIGNFLLDATGNIKLCDFGLAVKVGAKTKTLAGTDPYHALESWTHDIQDQSTDSFATGLAMLAFIRNYRRKNRFLFSCSNLGHHHYFKYIAEDATPEFKQDVQNKVNREFYKEEKFFWARNEPETLPGCWEALKEIIPPLTQVERSSRATVTDMYETNVTIQEVKSWQETGHSDNTMVDKLCKKSRRLIERYLQERQKANEHIDFPDILKPFTGDEKAE